MTASEAILGRGAADFIVKPFKAEDVLAVVNKVLAARGR